LIAVEKWVKSGIAMTTADESENVKMPDRANGRDNTRKKSIFRRAAADWRKKIRLFVRYKKEGAKGKKERKTECFHRI
jgi:hypothetical protein